MALNDALSAAGFTLVLSIGLQFIGHAQYHARMARERWAHDGGAAGSRLLHLFSEEAAASVAGLRKARSDMQATARQIRGEVS